MHCSKPANNSVWEETFPADTEVFGPGRCWRLGLVPEGQLLVSDFAFHMYIKEVGRECSGLEISRWQYQECQYRFLCVLRHIALEGMCVLSLDVVLSLPYLASALVLALVSGPANSLCAV